MRIKTIILSACTIMACGTFSACDDIVEYNDNPYDPYKSDGVPIITGIYDAKTEKSENIISEGSLSQMIRIEGENLSHVKSISFNGIEVDKSHIYAESGKCLVTIPRKTPKQADNKLVYITEKGSVTYDFKVTFPSININNIENEFAKPGSTVLVCGDFGLYNLGRDNMKVYVGDKECSIGDTTFVSDTQTNLMLTIPKDAPDCQGIRFVYTKPDGVQGETLIPYRMYQYSIMPQVIGEDGLYTDDLAGWWNNDTKEAFTDGTKSGDPESLGYHFFHIKGEYSAWCWQSFGWKTDWQNADATLHPENYELKFELWNEPSHPFYNSINDNENADGYIWSINDSPEFEWNISRGTRYNTNGKWVTISLPLSDVAGNGLTQVVEGQQNFMNVNFVIQPCDEENDWELDFAIANIRIQPKSQNTK